MTETLLNSTVETTAAATTEVAAEVVAQPTVAESTATTTNWLDALPEDLKTAKSLQHFKSAEDLAKSYINANSLLGKKVSEWAAEDIKALYGKLGRPETPDAYVLPDEVSIEVKEFAFEAGLSQEQAKLLADKIALSNRAEVEQNEEAVRVKLAEVEKELKAEWGTAYETRLNMAKQAAIELGGQEFLDKINEAGLGADPTVLKTLSKIGKEFLQGDRIVAADRDAKWGMTPGEAKAQIDQLYADKEFRNAYFSANHPGHQLAVARMTDLVNKMHG